MSALPTRAPVELEDRPRHQHWLIDTLWGREAVGIIGGEPKCGKSFLALDLAVAVASGVACLRHFPTAHPGPVVLFAAEDAGHIVRTRLEDIARAATTPFRHLDIAVIDVPALRLDLESDRQRLHDTVERIRPRLLVLDPLVRLHRVDENAVAEIAPILAFLRELQRRFYTAVVLVHHARKSAATRPGQALRGSSELHAWGDSNLYLRRRKGQIVMSVEHRAAASLNDIALELADDGHGAALRLRHDTAHDDAPHCETPQQRIIAVLADAEQPLSQRQIRERAATRHTRHHHPRDTVREGCIVRRPVATVSPPPQRRNSLAIRCPAVPTPGSPIPSAGNRREPPPSTPHRAPGLHRDTRPGIARVNDPIPSNNPIA